MPAAPRLFPFVTTITLILRRRAFSQGIVGHSRFWRIVAVLIFSRRILRKLFGKHPEVVTIEKLRPGQAMMLRTIPAVSRRERRRSTASR